MFSLKKAESQVFLMTQKWRENISELFQSLPFLTMRTDFWLLWHNSSFDFLSIIRNTLHIIKHKEIICTSLLRPPAQLNPENCWMFLALHLVSRNQKSFCEIQPTTFGKSGRKRALLLVVWFNSQLSLSHYHPATCLTSLASSPGVGQFVISLKSLDCESKTHITP